ncbi:acyltransferase family-domain-containing protein [Phlyctochytrium arcticum]|nr:acyltransferase family-domain-containing protein [Phlyctochytrium arcticum]
MGAQHHNIPATSTEEVAADLAARDNEANSDNSNREESIIKGSSSITTTANSAKSSDNNGTPAPAAADNPSSPPTHNEIAMGRFNSKASSSTDGSDSEPRDHARLLPTGSHLTHHQLHRDLADEMPPFTDDDHSWSDGGDDHTLGDPDSGEHSPAHVRHRSRLHIETSPFHPRGGPYPANQLELNPIKPVDDSHMTVLNIGLDEPSPKETHPLRVSPTSRNGDTGGGPTAALQAKSRGPGKLEYLEGIRGVAALLVVHAHYLSYPMGYSFWIETLSKSWRWIPELLIQGKLAVAIFFVLSGRVIILGFTKKPDLGRLASVFLRRSFRMIIPVLGSLLIQWAVFGMGWYNWVQGAPELFEYWKYARDSINGLERPSLSDSIIRTITLFIPGGKPPSYPNRPQWTIPVELGGSFFVYVVALLFAVYPRRRYLGFALLTFYFFWIENFLADFMVGLWIADLANAGALARLMKSRWIWPTRILVTLITILSVIPSPAFEKFIMSWAFDTYNGVIGRVNRPNFWEFEISYFFAASAFIFLVEISPGVQRFFELSPIRALGRLSFGMYLLHPVVFLTFGSSMIHFAFGILGSWPHFLKLLIAYLGTIIITLMAAWCFSKTFDQWSIDFGRWLELRAKEDEPWSLLRTWNWARRTFAPRAIAAWLFAAVLAIVMLPVRFWRYCVETVQHIPGLGRAGQTRRNKDMEA